VVQQRARAHVLGRASDHPVAPQQDAAARAQGAVLLREGERGAPTRLDPELPERPGDRRAEARVGVYESRPDARIPARQYDRPDEVTGRVQYRRAAGAPPQRLETVVAGPFEPGPAGIPPDADRDARIGEHTDAGGRAPGSEQRLVLGQRVGREDPRVDARRESHSTRRALHVIAPWPGELRSL
jgi:hypothetical protein